MADELWRVPRPDGGEWVIDDALWVEIEGRRGYIVGSAHTFPGRFHSYFPEEGAAWTCSLYDLTEQSEAARWWLAGFLHGGEPDAWEYLGRVGEDYMPTEEEFRRWEAYVQRFRQTGLTPPLPKRPNRAVVITDEERAEIRLLDWHPWTFVGERVLVPSDDDWVEATPQPEMDGPFLAGSICALRGYGDLLSLGSGWSVCCDCGEITDDL